MPEPLLTSQTVARHGYEAATRHIPMVAAGHPVPDECSIRSAERALELARSAGADDLVLVLLSGGGSANWVAPAGDLTLAEKQAVNKALLRSGAPIGEMNIVRKRLSRIKGGRLALAAAPARLVTLAISDVPGDEPTVIASGPTVPDPSSMADARAIVARYGLDLPPAARVLLAEDASDTPKPGDPAFADSVFQIIARPQDAIATAVTNARDAGYEPVDLGADLEGEAREVAADEGAKKPEPFEQEAEVVADGGEDGVGGVALGAGQAVAGHGVLILEVADDRLDGGAAPELAFDGPGDVPLLALDDDF